MLVNVSPKLDRSEVELETDFKVVREFLVSGREEITQNGVTFTLMDFPPVFLYSHLYSKDEDRISFILRVKKVLKGTFIHDQSNGIVFYYGRVKTETEKFADIVEDLF